MPGNAQQCSSSFMQCTAYVQCISVGKHRVHYMNSVSPNLNLEQFCLFLLLGKDSYPYFFGGWVGWWQVVETTASSLIQFWLRVFMILHKCCNKKVVLVDGFN